MSNYYEEQRKAFKSLEIKLRLIKEYNLEKLLYDLTLEFSVSESALKKRIEKMRDFGHILIKNKKVYWILEEKDDSTN